MNEEVTWSELKAMAGEFFRALPTLEYDQAQNGFKCLTLGYFALVPLNDNEQYQAEILIQLASQKMLEKEFECDLV